MYTETAGINFDDYTSNTNVRYDNDTISIPVKLIKHVVTYYKYKNSYDYQEIIDEAIALNNLVALNILWRGHIHYTKTVTNLEYDVYRAIQYANLDTIKFTLHAYINISIGFNIKPLSYAKLRRLASKNTTIVQYFIELLNTCAIMPYNIPIIACLNTFCKENGMLDKMTKQEMLNDCIECVYDEAMGND